MTTKRNSPASGRKSTNKRGAYRSGKARTSTILRAAKSVLVSGGYSEFTMRRIARESKIELRHLHYYFNTKSDLLQALLDDTCAGYDAQLLSQTSKTDGTPETRFLACIDYLLHDNQQVESNAFFFELWALSCHDDAVQKILRSLYDHYCAQIAELIHTMHPKADQAELHQRAVLIVALIEGLTLFIGRKQTAKKAQKAIIQNARHQILRIASDDL